MDSTESGAKSMDFVAGDYRPAVDRVSEYLAAEMDAASPSAVVAYRETVSGDVIELTLSDLVSVAYIAQKVTRDHPGGTGVRSQRPSIEPEEP